MQLHPGQGQPRDPMCSVLTALPCTPRLPARLAQGSHPPRVAPAANTLWHLPRDPAVQQRYFFLTDLQIILLFSTVSPRSVLLARDQGQAPAASVSHPGTPAASPAGKPAARLLHARCLQQQQLFLPLGRRVDSAAPLPASSCPAPLPIPTLAPVTHMERQRAAYTAACTLHTASQG